ncbi:hypothetical protein C8R43DRAFT_1118298 [Mycena crocata]|nr:hypothetical protein C8R43DRAFT_1118298 [Mycena crocata]
MSCGIDHKLPFLRHSLLSESDLTIFLPTTSSLLKMRKRLDPDLSLLLLTLSDPMHAQAACIFGLAGVFDKVMRQDGLESSHRHMLFRAAFNFLSASRTAEENAALRAQLFECHCPAELHQGSAVGVLDIVIRNIGAMLTEHLEKIGPGKLLKRVLPPQRPPWPNRVEDLIPVQGGGRDVVTALVHWAVIVPHGSGVFPLVAALARFWEPFFIEVRQMPDVILLIVQHMQRALDSHDSGQLYNPMVLADFYRPLFACARFFEILSELSFLETLTLMRPVYDHMYTIALAIEPLLTPNDEDTVIERWFHFVRGMRPNFHPETPRTLHPGDDDPRKSFVMAHNRMAEARNHNQCLHFPCRTETDKRLLICSQCRIVRYCSGECQRLAWGAGSLSHKTVCKSIKALRVATSTVDNDAWDAIVSDTCDHHEIFGPRHLVGFEFSATCLKYGVDPAVAEVILKELNEIMEARRTFLASGSESRSL